MGRRHDALIPLTHDHHHALHNVRVLRLAADEDLEGRKRGAESFIDFFRAHSVRHFRREEEEIFPLVALRDDAPHDGILRVLADHMRIHALVAQLARETQAGDPSPDTMLELAHLLRVHIRFEEDELFPAIERVVPDDLRRMALPARRN